jgi:hypothetical protein
MERPFSNSCTGTVVNGKLGWSSGSIPHMVDATPDGRILMWPIVEGSLTPTPAEPQRTTVQAIRSRIAALEREPIEPQAKEASKTASGEPSIDLGSQLKRSSSMLDIATLRNALKGMGLSPEQILEVISAMEAAEQQNGGTTRRRLKQ